MISIPSVQLEGLPPQVTVYEVGARDGLQNEAVVLPVAVKAEFIRRLSRTGLTVIEATSLVRPDRVPALADAEELLGLLDLSGPVRHPVLVPNERGLDRALSLGVQEIAVFASATETFAQRNLGRGLEDSLTMFEPVVGRAKQAGLRVRAYVSMCWGDPWEGPVDPAAVVSVVTRLREMGSDEVSLGDTIGVATAGAVERLLGMMSGLHDVAVHFHDTYGQALANTLTALRSGITTVDSSAGGLGGCPFAKSATGNLATEDLVWMLNGLGIRTGLDLTELVRCSVWMAQQLGRPSPSAVVRALAAEVADA
ncbi:MAG: hydroxymethylglutaryl-CoA lyase [Frankiales bacterium]|jgi:hydroxymethylglutaryl-CoA lyase|nr:hydroxymethylglutaryl-CoA lyase [Frankiales bacterium]